jgi:hypothetical protein
MKLLMLSLSVLLATACPVVVAQSTQPATPGRVTYVIDASVSMKPKFADARATVLAAIKDLPADTQFAILIDIADVTQRHPVAGLTPANPANEAAAERFLNNDRLVPKGEGKLDIAVATACKMKPSAVWLMSDGDIANNSDVVVKRIIASARESKVAIHTRLALAGTRKREEVLLQIARETGGTCLNDKGEAITELPPIKDNTHKPGGNIFDQH